MHIVFLNPQGNFDPADSYLAEHPDFGGQLVYVKEVAQAMVDLGHQVDIVTRQIKDPSWPEFSAHTESYSGYEGRLRILRFPCGGTKFLEKERLWPHMPEFVDNMLGFYGAELPKVATAHYADGGYCGVLAKQRVGMRFTFTGHSLGAQKLDKLGTNTKNWSEMDKRYQFARRIAAERHSMTEAMRIIVSTDQEKREQYGHPLYEGAVASGSNECFSVVPPGVNGRIFTTYSADADVTTFGALDARFKNDRRPVTVVSSRLDEKKNIVGVVRAFADTERLRKRAGLVICVRGVDDPDNDVKFLAAPEKAVLEEILEVIASVKMRENVYFLNIGSQSELAATYRYFAVRGSVFALTSFYEPFGLAPIEAAAAGLAPVVTQNGGPSEIFSDGSGILIDPFCKESIADGLIEGFDKHAELSEKAVQRVQEMYTWKKTAKNYLSAISHALELEQSETNLPPVLLDSQSRIEAYLKGLPRN